MTSLKDQWQIQRQQRQAEIAQRQQQVQVQLANCRDHRQVKAVQLRNDLSLFTMALQDETQQFLTQVSQARTVQQQIVAQRLQAFVQQLQQETADFLALTAVDRELMAQELTQHLQQFHVQLQDTVTWIRSDIQAQVNAIRSITQMHLAQSYQDRTVIKAEMTRDVAIFIDQLRSQINTYLAELDILRQERAYELQAMLQQSRAERLDDVATLFADIAILRSQLQHYRHQLRAEVWGPAGLGTSVERSPQASVRRPIATPPAMPPRSAVVAPPSRSVSQPAATVAPRRAATPPLSPPRPAPPAVTAIRTVPKASPPAVAAAVTPPLRSIPPSATPTATIERSTPVPTTASAAPMMGEPDDLAAIENAVYTCIQTKGGLRLNELEAQLGINRFQAVDALRSLIRKERITQRDRVYLVNEELS